VTTAFVAGATGYTGSAVVRALASAGVKTIAHVRPDSTELNFWHAQFRDAGAEIDTTAWNAGAMSQTLAQRQPDLVFALLGTTAKRARIARNAGVDASYEAVDYQLTQTLLQACLNTEPQPRFVYLSSMGVQANSRTRYMQVRWRVEQEILKSGIPCTIARPCFITGPDRRENRTLERVGATSSDVVLELVGLLGFRGVKNRYQSTTAQHLALSLVRHALHPNTAQQVLEANSLRP